MCGIVVQLGGKGEYLKDMLQAIAHRGETVSYWHYKNLHVGFTRLAIRGLQDDPPYIAESLVGWMVGENYAALTTETLSDTAWTLNRINFTRDYNYLNGMYHLVYCDKKNKNLHIVTDPRNKKPIYTTTVDNTTQLFASEIKGLLAHPKVKRTVNSNYFYTLEHSRFVDNTSTPWVYIKSLYPGMEQVYDMRHWDTTTSLHVESGPPPVNNDLTNLIIDAVKYRLLSDRPIGLLLSGGLDSSLIYWIITQVFRFKDFQIIHFENEESEYLKYLDIPSDRITFVDYRKDCFDFIDVLRTNESPVDLGSMIPQYMMAKTIAEKFPEIKVLITGDGADEIFCGYKRCIAENTRNYDLRELRWYHNPRLDKMNARFTLEQRSPYQDFRIINTVKEIPWVVMRGKQMLKEVAQNLDLPHQIINREKKPLKVKPLKEDKRAWQKYARITFIEEVMLNG